MSIKFFHVAVLALCLVYPAAASPGKEYTSLVNCLSTKFPQLTKLIVEQGLTQPIWQILKSGGSITVMAPTDRAVAAYKPTCPGAAPNLKDVLLIHTLKGKLFARRFINLGIRSKFPTNGPRELTKLSSSPPLIGVTKGKKTESFARITATEVCFTRNTMVHEINRVLYFCP